MASEGPGVSSTHPEDQHEGDTPLTETGLLGDANTAKDTQKVTEESPEHKENGVNVCHFFQMGKCHFGHRCRLSHSETSADDSQSASHDRDDKPGREKTDNPKKKVNKSPKAKPNEAKELDKKPRMRTADDVISRILWDSSAQASEFVVGYVDRFLGVLERPFEDFNWDTDPTDCDYTTELALPRHRIQYFTYRGHRVWDRHSRTDRVFGSTGQSLAPPFGGEAEVKEVQEQQQDVLQTTEEKPPVAVCGQEESETQKRAEDESTHLGEGKLSEMKIDDPGNTPKEQQQAQEACDVEENTVSLKTSASQKEAESVTEERKEETQAEWDESWEGKEDTVCYLKDPNVSQNPPAPLEQRDHKPGGGGGRPDKKRPTHFVTFRANTPAILSGFRLLQEEITAALPSSAPHWQSAASLHVTLCLLVLRGPAEVASAGEILRRFAFLDRNPPVALTFPVKLKHFGGRVLYLSPQPQLHLQQLNAGLQDAYRTEGLLHRDSYNPRYHLTLAKVEDRDADRVFAEVGDLKVGKGLNFGRLPVNTLHLCAMGMSEVDGFYETVCTVTLR